MIHLEPVTRDNIEELIGLAVRKDQQSFVSTVAESLAQAYVYSDNAYPFAVYENDTFSYLGIERHHIRRKDYDCNNDKRIDA